MDTEKRDLRGFWPWHSWWRNAWCGALTSVPVIVAGALYPAFGAKAALVLPAAGIGIGCWAMYWWVGSRVDRARRSITDVPAGEKARPVVALTDAIIVHGMLESPGIAVLRPDVLELIPIVGKAVTVSLKSIISIRQKRWFNGRLYFLKRGIRVSAPGEDRLGFVISGTLAPAWLERLTAGADGLGPNERAKMPVL